MMPLKDLEVGSNVLVCVNVYGWANENENHELHYKEVEITEITGYSGMNDIVFETNDGKTYRYYVDNGYVSGSAENTDNVPNRTDIGRMRGFYKEKPEYLR